MAVFVELEDDDLEPPQHPSGDLPIWKLHNLDIAGSRREQPPAVSKDTRDEAHEFAVQEFHNRNALTEALGCYPIISAITANIDLNTLDNLSQTCRQVRADLLQYRKPLLATTLRCCNDDLPVDGEETLRYRARAGNWFYMEETGRSGNYNGKAGECARDMVSECRRCGTVVCRNCAIKPPMPVVLRDRHRRLCRACVKAPIGELCKPRLPPDVSIDSDDVQRAVCKCATSGVWLCQPCGRSIRGADFDYQAIWKWRNQYGDPHGNVGIGIGEGDRGVICGREGSCCAAKEREQEIDCDAEDARGEGFVLGSSPATHSTVAPPWSSESSLPTALNASWTFMPPNDTAERTPSPALGPGYARHEVEGIGGVIKKTMVKMVKIGACVPEYREERQNSLLMQREIQGRVRSWCGWCWRVIPSRKDLDGDDCAASSGSSSSSES